MESLSGEVHFAHNSLLTFDVTDCAHLTPLGALALARMPHEFFLWRAGTQVLAYVTAFHAAPPVILKPRRAPQPVGMPRERS